MADTSGGQTFRRSGSSGFEGAALSISSYWVAGMVAVPVLAAAVVIALLKWNGLAWGFVFADPASLHGFSVMTGMFSHLGVLGLTAVAAVCLFGRTLIRASHPTDESAASVLGIVALLSIALALDDLFLLHERLFRHGLGLSETVIYLGYGLLGLVIVWKLKAQAFTRGFLALWIAVALLSLMALVDKLEKVVGTPALLLLTEEVSKLVGFVVWSCFWTIFAFATTARTISAPRAA